MRFDIVLNNLVAWATTKGQIYLKSDGSPWRPIVHIEDISRAFIAALEAPIEVVSNQAFNVGQTAHNYRIREIAQVVAEVVPRARIEFAEDAGPDTRSYRVSFEKIAKLLPSFKPIWDVRKGAEQVYAAYRSIGPDARGIRGAPLPADQPYPNADERRPARWRIAAHRVCGGVTVDRAHEPWSKRHRCPGSATQRGSGAIIYDIASQLYPICRSITGDGVRAVARHSRHGMFP